MTIPKEFFTAQSMLTLTGASGATYIICNGLQRAINFNPKWLALGIALAISIFGVIETSDNKPGDYFVGIVNGFLIYCTAAGGTEISGGKGSGTGAAKGPTMGGPSAPVKRKFNTSWFN